MSEQLIERQNLTAPFDNFTRCESQTSRRLFENVSAPQRLHADSQTAHSAHRPVLLRQDAAN